VTVGAAGWWVDDPLAGRGLHKVAQHNDKRRRSTSLAGHKVTETLGKWFSLPLPPRPLPAQGSDGLNLVINHL
jgi:hypothetical protein